MKELTEILRLLAKAIEQNTVNTYQEQGSAAADVVFRILEDAEKRIDALHFAVNALEKQIPKKPIATDEQHIRY